MRAICSVARDFRKVEFARLTGLTKQLIVASGDRPITWSTVPYPQQESAAWLGSNATEPMGTEPFGPSERGMEQIQYRRCKCWLQCEWCICART